MIDDALENRLRNAGADHQTLERLARGAAFSSSDYAAAKEAVSGFLVACESLRAQIASPPGEPDDAETALLEIARSTRKQFLEAHAAALYRELTDNFARPVRVDDLVFAAAEAVPGLTPSRPAWEEEMRRPLREKTGIEYDQGIFLAAVLGDETCGHHLCNAMLMPKPGSLDRLAEYRETGSLDLGQARLDRAGKATVVTMQSPEALNAENEPALVAMEHAVDIGLLDPESELCILRGGPVSPPRYEGRRVFSAGINLTDLYWGRISYLFYIVRDMGLVNKIYRGLSQSLHTGFGGEPETREKLWIGAIEEFAIGGGCQLALVMDYLIANRDAYFTLPARKEGIVPGLANLRLPRFVGDRLARQAIMYDRRIDAAAPEGAFMCDLVVENGEMDAALERTAADLTDSGMVSAAGNRKAMRIGAEPLDLFRQYMAVYALEQAQCHLSPALTANLEANWNAKNRRPKD